MDDAEPAGCTAKDWPCVVLRGRHPGPMNGSLRVLDLAAHPISGWLRAWNFGVGREL